jgi:hypothetical protein
MTGAVMTRSSLPGILGSLAILALASSGCAQGFQSAQELESAGRAPTHCAKSCETLNMRMSAFVLVEKDVAACVCEPVASMPTAAAPAAPAAVPAPPPAPAAAPAPAAPAPAAPAPATGAEAPQSINRSATGAAAGYIVIALRREQESRSNRSRTH